MSDPGPWGVPLDMPTPSTPSTPAATVTRTMCGRDYTLTAAGRTWQALRMGNGCGWLLVEILADGTERSVPGLVPGVADCEATVLQLVAG